MGRYIVRRLILLPITLFFIVLVNFVIINLAPGDPITLKQLGDSSEARKSEKEAQTFKTEDPYVVFREHYGLTLPILFNTWPLLDKEDVFKQVNLIKTLAQDKNASVKEYTDLKALLGDEARFIMPLLLSIINDNTLDLETKKVAMRAFIRGGTRFAELGHDLSQQDMDYNCKIAFDNTFLREQLPLETKENLQEKIENLNKFYNENKDIYHFEANSSQKFSTFFSDTRFYKYFSRVLTLDFGVLRNNDQKKVIDEVTSRIKYSLTLSLIPLIITFFLCQIFGLIMAIYQNTFIDRALNLTFLMLYAIPVFVVAPFLIEKIALNNNIPFLNIPFPLGGFTYPDVIYNQETSLQRLGDISVHIALPMVAILYGSLAVQARIARTAMLEVMRLDYVRTARAKGVSAFDLYVRHVGRNGAITIITSVASSLGVILGGSLIVETLFQINGFGKFFYEAILNRDYNVMMFSALAGSFLTLAGYLVADIAYTLLDPRVSFD
jgi:peptide/nickel transport system permease protein